MANIAANTIQAWRRARTMRPNMKTWAAGMSRMAIISTKLDRPVGFSNGTAELEL